MNNKYLLIYHKEDNDGVFSGALLYEYLINYLKINKELIDLCPADYNLLNEFSEKCDIEYLQDNYKSIIMTDISFNNWKYMKKLYKAYENDFVWCDHHAPIIHLSQVNRFNDIPGVRDTGRSAILCVWKYLYDQFDEKYNKKKVPELLRILSAFDSWTYIKEGYDFEYVRNVNKGVTVRYDRNIDNVYPLIENIVNLYVRNENNPSKEFSGLFKEKPLIKELEKYGKSLCEYDDFTYKNLLEEVGDFSWKIITDNKTFTDSHGEYGPTFRPAVAIFHCGQTSSNLFKSIRETHPDIMNAIVFKHQPNGNWCISLYNVRECDEQDWPGRFHCGDYLQKHYNGGGHPGAAGCTITQDQFIKILKKKELGE